MTEAVTLRIPASTYRLQFNRSFTFADASRIIPYLSELGISDCYASSYLRAVPGSPHGYDLVDPTSLNEEVGTEEEYREFVRALQQQGMGQILDMVPNHMGIGRSSNAWWLDVLENGPSSPYSAFFDIDWRPIKPELADKVLLPILGDRYGTVLENQEIRLAYQDGSFVVHYDDHRLPVAPKSSVRILTHRLDDLVRRVGEGDPQVQELQSIITALRHLPDRSERDSQRVAERYREKEISQKRLAALVRESRTIGEFVEENVRSFNGTKGDPRSFDLLDDLLNEQAYRLAYWLVAAEEINYRRFFDVNELAAIRMEDPAVFEAYHRLIFRLVKEGAITGFRIDHVDGLYDPKDYLRQLQDRVRTELSSGEPGEGPPLFLIVEKILIKDETLPENWPVHGTTGYDFLNLVNNLFVNGRHERAFDRIYARFIGKPISFEDLAYQSKRLIMRLAMASEVNVLGHQLNLLSERDRRFRDFTLNSLTHAIREIIACLPVYRTYVTEGAEGVTERDRAYITRAVADAKRRNPALSSLVFDFVEALLLKQTDDWAAQDQRERVRFVLKFQQTTSPVTAKGIEDTAFYLYNRLTSLNEVGGDPEQFGLSVPAFHEKMRARQARWPASLSATSTHDTKRSEDVRARIDVLSELPQAWQAHLLRWSRLNKKHCTIVDGEPAPDRNEEYLLYQTLVGAWPLGPLADDRYRTFCERIQSYMAKALREAKLHTSWVNPNHDYERAVADFIRALLQRAEPNRFLEEFLPFQEQVARSGMSNSLSQLVLKIAAPGIPDFYQGTELWDFSLVDPDNRRPVDYARRMSLLADLERAGGVAGSDRRTLVRELLTTWTDGRIKLYATRIGLRFRRDHAPLFLEGHYVPLESQGVGKDHLCAFARIHADQAVVAVVPRLVAGLTADEGTAPVGQALWGDTALVVPSWKPESVYRNLFTEEQLLTTTMDDRQALPIARVLGEFPVALLERIT